MIGFKTRFQLRLYDGVFVEEMTIEDWEIAIAQYAHQIHKTLLTVQVTGRSRSQSPKNLTMSLTRLTLNESKIDDMEIVEKKSIQGVSLIKYRPLIQEDPNVLSPILTVAFTDLPEEINFSENGQANYTFLVAAVVNCTDQIALQDLEMGSRLSGSYTLYQEHIAAWHKIWDDGGRLDIQGDDDLAQSVHAGFYYLLSSSPTDPFDFDSVHGWPNFGLSPASLAHSDEQGHNYWGHIFWDQETWMLPALVPFHPNVVRRILVDTRIRRLQQAMEKAQRMGWKGSMFPWEVGYSGIETTNWEPAASREIHITGDIAHFVRQYFYWTKDDRFLKDQGGYNLSYQVASFWASRLIESPDHPGLYTIDNVMGPDEHHDHVNSSIYTNALASICLKIPHEFYEMIENGSGLPEPDPEWIKMGEKIYLPFDEELQFHPEYDGYKNGTQIKQADVVLLGYPLLLNMSEAVRKNDLEIYEKNTSPIGPCMTWSMHSIGWLDLSDQDRAYKDFKRNFLNIRGPFKVWTETALGGGAVNFITGIGGFLQNLLYGYLGFRIHSDRLDFDPKPIPGTEGFVVSKVKYFGKLLTFSVNVDEVKVDVESENGVTGIDACFLYTYKTGETVPLPKSAVLKCRKYAVVCS